MWYAIYRQSDGGLVSVGTSTAPEDVLEASGLTKIELGEDWSREGLAWDVESRAFVEAVQAPQPVSQLDFLRRFTVQERVAVRAAASSDPIVTDFLDLLNRAAEVHLDATDTIAGINYLVSVGLLTSERAAEVLG